MIEEAVVLYDTSGQQATFHSSLPDPLGPLSEKVPSSSVAAANSQVKALLQGEEAATSGKRGQYATFSPEPKLEIGERAAEAWSCRHCGCGARPSSKIKPTKSL